MSILIGVTRNFSQTLNHFIGIKSFKIVLDNNNIVNYYYSKLKSPLFLKNKKSRIQVMPYMHTFKNSYLSYWFLILTN